MVMYSPASMSGFMALDMACRLMTRTPSMEDISTRVMSEERMLASSRRARRMSFEVRSFTSGKSVSLKRMPSVGLSSIFLMVSSVRRAFCLVCVSEDSDCE